jgi:hypothetical protein
VDEIAFRNARGEINRLPCIFERALLARHAVCELAANHQIAERESIACTQPAAHADCAQMAELLREKSSFALHLAATQRILPHAMVMKIQCGGLDGLRALLDPAALGAQRAAPGAPGPRVLWRFRRPAVFGSGAGRGGLEAAPPPSAERGMIAGMAALVRAVQTNCDIADARHARDVSLCTYLLGMREFYRWEHQLPYGASPPRDQVGRWIAEREARWEQIADADFVAVPVAGREFDAFDANR